jgi:hypothetical protein
LLAGGHFSRCNEVETHVDEESPAAKNMVFQQVGVHIVARGSWSSNGYGSIVHFPARFDDVSCL